MQPGAVKDRRWFAYRGMDALAGRSLKRAVSKP